MWVQGLALTGPMEPPETKGAACKPHPPAPTQHPPTCAHPAPPHTFGVTSPPSPWPSGRMRLAAVAALMPPRFNASIMAVAAAGAMNYGREGTRKAS